MVVFLRGTEKKALQFLRPYVLRRESLTRTKRKPKGNRKKETESQISFEGKRLSTALLRQFKVEWKTPITRPFLLYGLTAQFSAQKVPDGLAVLGCFEGVDLIILEKGRETWVERRKTAT